jgi:hypothetical protein
MTEAEWNDCTESNLMLEFLRESGSACVRKLRLFAAACCRRAWNLLDADGQAVVEAAERFADGSLTESELMAAVWASRSCQNIEARAAADYTAVGAWRLVVATLADVCGQSPGPASSRAEPATPERERAVQADLLRCVFGPLPFRTLDPDPRWRTPLVLSLAQAAYQERVAPDSSFPGWLTLDPARLLVMADALEETGADAQLLAHLRGGGEHIRGCWCLDLLLDLKSSTGLLGSELCGPEGVRIR